MDLLPIELTLASPDVLHIVWSDHQTRNYSVRELRDNCPCATCREKRSADVSDANPFAILKPGDTLPLRIAKMEPVGRYAYSIHFSDGHNTGIYTLENLRNLGQAAPSLGS